MGTGTVDITENGATRLMAALAAEEIRDFFNGCDNKKEAEGSLQLLLQIIADAVPATPNSEGSCTQSTITQHGQPKIPAGMVKCGECGGKGRGEFNECMCCDGRGYVRA